MQRLIGLLVLAISIGGGFEPTLGQPHASIRHDGLSLSSANARHDHGEPRQDGRSLPQQDPETHTDDHCSHQHSLAVTSCRVVGFSAFSLDSSRRPANTVVPPDLRLLDLFRPPRH
jgi:hypothetical protein